jgi:hypothetical protein
MVGTRIVSVTWLRFDGREHGLRPELRHRQAGAAHQALADQPAQPRHMEQRRHQQRHGFRRVVQLRAAGHAGSPEVGVREHHALGAAGGAAGVEQRGQGVAPCTAVFAGRVAGCRSGQGLQVQRCHAAGRQALGQRGVGQQQRRFAVRQRIGQFGAAPAGVERAGHRTQPPAGQDGAHQPIVVGRQHGHAIARADAPRSQRAGLAGHRVEQVAKGLVPDGAAAVDLADVDQRGLVRMPLQRAVQALSQVHGAAVSARGWRLPMARSTRPGWRNRSPRPLPTWARCRLRDSPGPGFPGPARPGDRGE